MTALIIAILLIVITITIDFGPQQIVFPFMPFSNTYLRYMYVAIFLGLYSVFLPLTESGFYLVLHSNLWDGQGVLGDVLVSLTYGLVNFAGFAFVLRGSGGIFWSIFLGVICALLMYLYLYKREKYSFLYAVGIRVGISVGVGLYIAFMVLNFDRHFVTVKTPKYFFPVDTRNLLYRKVFSNQ